MWKKMRKDPMVMICFGVIVIVLLLGIFAHQIAPHNPDEINVSLKYAAASPEYPLGNDYLGRCVFSRLLYGILPSVLLVVAAMLCTIGIGMIVGLIAGYFKGWVDEFFMRVCDIMLSFPAEVMVLAVVGIFGVGLRNILLAIIALRWAWFARVFRTAVMKYTDKNYVQFAKATGCGPLHIIGKHVLPSVVPEIVVIASNNISLLILSISGFSFLGFGIQPPAAEWGMMLSEAKTAILLHPGQMLPPGIAIIIVCVAFSFLGDSLRDAMDSKHEKYVSISWTREPAKGKGVVV